MTELSRSKNPGSGCLMLGEDNPGLALNLNSDMKA